jgi:hypothetical protein
MKKQASNKMKGRGTPKKARLSTKSVPVRNTPLPGSPLMKPSLAATILRSVAIFWIRHYQKVVLAFSVVALATYLGIVGVQVLAHAFGFDGFAMNGAFQALNPLQRMAAGQVLGSDFQFFHGIGVPLLHYPLYLLLGGDLVASEIARWGVMPVLFLASVIVLFRAVTKRWWIILLSSSLATYYCLWKLPAVIYPENSSLGLRSMTPVFIMAVILWKDQLSRYLVGRIPSLNLYHLLVSFLLVAAFLCGSEQGIAAGIAFTIVSLRFPRTMRLKQRFKELGKVIGLSAIWLLILLTVITQGHPLSPLKFVLLDLPADQGWYFGSPPNVFLQYASFIQDVVVSFNVTVVCIAVGLFVLLHRLRKHPLVTTRLEGLIFSLAAGLAALIAMFGYYAPTQLIPLARMNILAVLCLGICIAPLAVQNLSKLWRAQQLNSIKTKKRKEFSYQSAYSLAAILAMACCAYLLVFMVQSTRNQFQIQDLAKSAWHYVRGVNTENLGIGWQNTMNAIMPIVNQDNYATVVPKNDDGFTNGVSLEQRAVLVENDKFSPLIHPGQVVYLPISGRHRVASTAIDGQDLLVFLEAAHDLNSTDGKDGRMVIGERLDKQRTRMWSTYTALFESEAKTLQPTPGYDYIIHALGSEARQKYVDAFDKTQPEYTITIRRQYSYFEEWIQFTSWDFYQRVIDNYTPVKLTGSHILWQRKADQAWKKPDYQSNFQKLIVTGDTIKLPANPTDKYEVIVLNTAYSLSGITTQLPVINKAPRYLIYPRGTGTVSPISLPPYRTEWRYPIFLRPHSDNAELFVQVHSLVPGADLHISEMSYQALELDDATLQALMDKDGPLKP